MSFFDLEHFEELRKAGGALWGRPVRALYSCASTNDLALAAIDTPAKTGIVFLAHEQTEGRGRRGSTWIAPPGECLMFSILLRYPPTKSGTTGLSLAVGLALLDAIKYQVNEQEVALCQQLEPRLRLKWPNDLYAGDKKLAGVLIESRKDAFGQMGIVIGVGLNVSTLHFPKELEHATSLALLGITPPPHEELLLSLLLTLQVRVAQFLTQGCASIVRDTEKSDYLRGRALSIDGQRGIGAGISERGELLVTEVDGSTRAWSTGHVELLDQCGINAEI